LFQIMRLATNAAISLSFWVIRFPVVFRPFASNCAEVALFLAFFGALVVRLGIDFSLSPHHDHQTKHPRDHNIDGRLCVLALPKPEGKSANQKIAENVAWKHNQTSSPSERI
jgi:hypothetical protein